MDYKNGKIYSIRSYQTDEIYIGSTCSPLNKRMWNHKAKYKQYLNGKGDNISSFKILKYDDCYIELIEKYPCNDKIELHKREGEYIRNMNCVNKYIPGSNNKERCKQYRENNKDKIKQKLKEWYENNKKEILEKCKTKHNCDCGSIYTYQHKNRHKKTKKHRTYIFNLHNELNHL